MSSPPRDRLLDAAASLVKDGEPLTFSALSRQTRLARGTLYKHFSDVPALKQALIASGRLTADELRDPEERLLDAVGDLIRARGLAATTLDEVARAAGVSPVTLYRHFGDRQGLLRAFVLRRTPRRLATELPGTSTGDLEADLLHIATECLSFMKEHRAVFLLAFSTDAETAALFADLKQGSTSVRETVTRFMRERVLGQEGNRMSCVRPEDLTALFLGAILALGWEIGASPVEPRARLVVSTFLHGVL